MTVSARLLPLLSAGLCALVLAPAAQADALDDYRAAVMADAPLAYWHLDETAGTAAADFSGNASGGTFAGGVTLGAAPPFGAPANTAVRLDPTGTMTAQVPGTMNSVEFWVRPSQRVQQTFLTYGDPSADGWSISMNGADAPRNQKRRIVFEANGKITNSKVTLPTGSWSMVYVSWGPGNKLRFTVNGGALSKSPAPGGLPGSSPSLATLTIGPGAGSGGTTIDEVALFNDRPDPGDHFTPSTLPRLITPPQLSPLAGVLAGQTLSLTSGTWSAGTTVTDLWQRCDSVGACQTITSATGSSYVTQTVDAGFTIQVQETGIAPSGAIVVYTDATDPIALPNGSQPPAPPVLPPGTDPAVPESESQAAIDAGGQVVDPSGGSTGGSTGGTPAPAPAPAITPAALTPKACVARLAPVKSKRLRLRRLGRVTVRLDSARRVVTVRARRGALRRVRWTLDGKPLSARRGTTIRLPAVATGRHVLRGRLTPRRGRARTVTLRFTSACN